MTNRSILVLATSLLAACMLLGCSGKGCGKESGGESSATTDKGSQPAGGPLGVYEVERYQRSEGTCTNLVDETKPAYVVLYSFKPSDGSAESRLGGSFCENVDLCRALAAKAVEPTIGYSFLEGDQTSGWKGWAILNTGRADDKCKADVQAHLLTSVDSTSLMIETKTEEVLFEANVDGDTANCRIRDAIAAAEEDRPCKALLVLEGKRKADL